jgi:hypothetical protein
MFDRLDQLEARYEELGRQMSDPTLVNDQENFRKVAKAHRDLEPVVEKFRAYRKIRDGIAEAKAMLADADPEVNAMAAEELALLEPQLAPIEEELKGLLLPKDPNDEKNVILELRAGTGGDEAALFVAEVFRMYMRFAEQKRWKVEVLSQRAEGCDGDHRGHECLLAVEVRVGSASRAASAGDRDTGARAYVGDYGGSASGGRGGRCEDRGEGPADRYVLLVGPRRAEREYDLFGGADYAPADEHRCVVSGREVADQEPREGNARAAGAAV